MSIFGYIGVFASTAAGRHPHPYGPLARLGGSAYGRKLLSDPFGSHRAYPPFFRFPKWICPIILSINLNFTQNNLHNMYLFQIRGFIPMNRDASDSSLNADLICQWRLLTKTKNATNRRSRPRRGWWHLSNLNSIL